MRIFLTDNIFHRLTFTCLLLLAGIFCATAQNEETYDRLLHLESQALYDKGISYRTGETHLDSSLV